jgi:hypothetical protein
MGRRGARPALLAIALLLAAAQVGPIDGAAAGWQPPEPPIILAPQGYLPLVVGANLDPPGPPPPLLVHPPDGAELETLSPSFTLDNIAVGQPARAHLQFATDPAFGDIVRQYGYAPFQGQVTAHPCWNLAEGTTHYWRAWSAFDGVTWGAWSETWSFRTPSGGVLPGVPALLSPANGSTAGSLRPSLRWTAVQGATRYAVRIGSSTYLPLNNQYAVSEDLDADTIYTWHASARNDYGWGPTSQTWSFRTPPGRD